MFQKKFISIVFTSRKIQYLQLDSSKKTVVKFGSFDIPPGLIVAYQVKDVAVLSQLVAGTYKQLGLKEKAVGIVIPEFSTYTRAFNFPKLEHQELDEAVRWDAADFLPDSGKDMLMDWEIIGEEGETYKVLMAAIKKEALAGYVDAVSRAGLIPLIVETPSLSLVRVTDGIDVEKLVVYVSADETILVLGKGESILASSVANSSSQNEIIQTAQRLIQHYSKVAVEKVFVGGANLSGQFLNDFQANLGKKIELINIAIQGLTPAQVQEYIIPISLQLKDPVQPASEATINLLPKEWEKHFKERLTGLRYWTLTLFISVIVWVCLLAVVITYMLFDKVARDYEARETMVDDKVLTQVTADVERANNLSESVLSITESIVWPQTIVNQITKVKPVGIEILSFDLNLEKGTVKLIGKAADRSVLINFKKKIESTSAFDSIELPITSLVSETNLDFEMTFIYMPVMKETKKVPKLKI
ncbi:hypothetical protein A2382_00335 [Candidatus Woesebacteria bacterium RIFOXYB1_FULL_38_16]|uniref:Type IV pilus assembly protein PilM n=1 Tax=Candidatus Woesebacteria bacterium RIFOXYB1_FULL_38_16 TaxID=1802538 RepID=A0A1F8CU03_9BACT|nr:MAG: hypothetical protein A2191_01140 [Candidatus Woesebacteria bacterium RIFOXYA1_FULL_38_9]OGM79218.1 MAG: hypothetical protein A2382_00335 [Candidatus Woesebacteria bacterium RIFOXYB1_FULL_38_16]